MQDKKNRLSQKIIAGKFRGKKVQLPSKATTRSTKSIVKESFFNSLGYEVIDSIFVEGFGGSGSIGLEALSRGAKKAYFIEKDTKSYQILKKNCQAIAPLESSAFLADTFEKLPTILNTLASTRDEIVLYLDPPFDFREGMDDIYKKCFDMVRHFVQSPQVILLVFEHFSFIELPKSLGGFTLSKTKKFGKTSLSYYRFESQ